MRARTKNEIDNIREIEERLAAREGVEVDDVVYSDQWQRDDDQRITLSAGKLHEHASKAEAILIAAGVPFYVRDGCVVRPIIEEVPAFRGRKTKAVRLRQVTADMLRDQLSRTATFEKYNGRARKFVEVDPPHDIADILLARDGDWLFPPLAGVITTPTMRPDGSILSQAGYDPVTKLQRGPVRRRAPLLTTEHDCRPTYFPGL